MVAEKRRRIKEVSMKAPVDPSGELPTARGDITQDGLADSRFTLQVVEGPDVGLRLALDGANPARVLVGKSPMCTFRLTDDRVSRRHVSFRAIRGAIVVNDLGSTNGTLVNGVSVREAELRGGEAIRIGRTVLAVMRGAVAAGELSEETSFGRMLGASRAMRILYPVLRALAVSDAPVLLEGEAGVGKQLCAEELHAQSRRAARPFVALLCNALGPEEIEHQLFAPGGLLESSAGGTLFIDEVAALSVPTQRALARRLEDARSEDVRMLFATRHDLDREAVLGRASDELLAILAPTRVELPPLRHRDGDAPMLAGAFWSALAAGDGEGAGASLPADFVARFHDYPWPGNVRELARATAVRFNQGALGRWRTSEQSVMDGDVIGVVVDKELPLPEGRRVVVDEFERRYVTHMLARHGNTRDAARASGVALRYFQLIRARSEE
jgi:two-component system, NtrC family, response regulator HydG